MPDWLAPRATSREPRRLMSRAEFVERKELLPDEPGSDSLVAWVPLALSAAVFLVEVGSYGPAWLPPEARAACALAGFAGMGATLAGWHRGAARLYSEAGLVCAHCDRPLPLDTASEKVLLDTGTCPRCGFRTLSDPPIPGLENRLLLGDVLDAGADR